MKVTVSKNEFIDYAKSIGMKIISIEGDLVVMEIEPAPLKAPVPNPPEPKFRHLTGEEIPKSQHEQQVTFSIRMLSAGPQKIGVIKVVRSITGLGLAEAKNMVDNCPTVVVEAVIRLTADRWAQELRAAGATVEII